MKQYTITMQCWTCNHQSILNHIQEDSEDESCNYKVGSKPLESICVQCKEKGSEVITMILLTSSFKEDFGDNHK